MQTPCDRSSCCWREVRATARATRRHMCIDTALVIGLPESWVVLSKLLHGSCSLVIPTAAAAGVAGGVSRSATAPIDRLKMLLQIQDTKHHMTIRAGIEKMAAEGGQLYVIPAGTGWVGSSGKRRHIWWQQRVGDW